MTNIDLAYRLLDNEESLLQDGDEVAMQNTDAVDETKTFVCIYERRGTDVAADGEQVSIHLERIARLTPTEVEAAYWEKYDTDPQDDPRFVTSQSPESAAQDADT